MLASGFFPVQTSASVKAHRFAGKNKDRPRVKDGEKAESGSCRST